MSSETATCSTFVISPSPLKKRVPGDRRGGVRPGRGLYWVCACVVWPVLLRNRLWSLLQFEPRIFSDLALISDRSHSELYVNFDVTI